MNRLEICLGYQRGSGPSGIELAFHWSQLLKCPLSLFVNQPISPIDDMPLEYGSFATHNLNLSTNIDKYVRTTTNLKQWSPWGTKSGPNFQFFQIIDHYRSHPRADWVLFLEADTFCTSQSARTHVERLLESHSRAWVIGATPHTRVRTKLMPSLWDHINGACLLHVGDSELHDFTSQVWIPSLIHRIRTMPYYAYDCITAAGEWVNLPESLESDWMRFSHRFVRTSTMINMSNLSLSLQNIQKLTKAGLLDSQSQEANSIWFAHAKIREYIDSESQDDRRRILDALLAE